MRATTVWEGRKPSHGVAKPYGSKTSQTIVALISRRQRDMQSGVWLGLALGWLGGALCGAGFALLIGG